MQLLKDIDEKGIPEKLDILKAIFLASKAWDRVSQRTIANCFAHAGFNLHATENSFDEDDIPLAGWLRLQNDTDKGEEDEDGESLSLPEWVQTLPIVNLATEESWENFSNIDGELETEEDMTEDKILAGSEQNLESEINSDAVEMDETTEFQTPTIKDAFSAVETIQQFFMFNQNLKEAKTDFALLHLEKIIERNFLEIKKSQKQTRMTDFFVKI
ncbi:hypothetical protein CBL_21398 [Carabus blaptoides fortunei]